MNGTTLPKTTWDPRDLPLRPRVPGELRVSWYSSDVLLIIGMDREIKFSGARALRVLAVVLPLLRGYLDVAQICAAAAPVPRNLVMSVLHELNAKGALEEGDVAFLDLDADVASHAASNQVFARLLGGSRQNRSRYEVFARFRDARVVVLGETRYEPLLRALLEDLGIRHVSKGPPAPDSRIDWLICIQDRHDPCELDDAFRFAERAGAVLGVAVLDPARYFAMPSISPGQSACASCAALLVEPERLAIPDDCRSREWTDRSLLSRLCLTGLHVVPNLTYDSSGDTLLHLGPDGRLETQAVFQLPGCPCCGMGVDFDGLEMLAVSPAHRENFAVLLARRAQFVPREYSNRSYLEGFSQDKIDLMDRGYKRYVNHGEIDVRVDTGNLAASLRGPAGGTSERFKLLMQLVAGRTEESQSLARSVTPSGGGLRSQTIYLVNDRVEGLPEGLSYFNRRDALQPLDRTVRVRDLARACGLRGGDAFDAALVHCGSIARIETKYRKGNALGYTCMDFGAMFATLECVAGALGFDLSCTFEFVDDDVVAVLNNRTTTEIPLAISFLSGRTS